MAKVKLSITIEEELAECLENEVQSKRFGSKSHGVEVALLHLKKQIDSGQKIQYDF